MTGTQQEILNDLLGVEDGLRPAELTFIEDLDRNWRDRPLTSKQLEWLLRIADRLLLIVFSVFSVPPWCRLFEI